MTQILFVHGALVRDGAWWWQPVADLVETATGVRSTAIALPSCGEGTAVAGSSGLADDATALRRELDAVEGDALVVGHSYGGTVIAEGADHHAARATRSIDLATGHHPFLSQPDLVAAQAREILSTMR